MSIWNGFDQSDIEIHLDELNQESTAYRTELEAEADDESIGGTSLTNLTDADLREQLDAPVDAPD